MFLQSPPKLILASTSRYRRELLERFGLPFECRPSGVDEAARPGEAPAALVARLARAKAGRVAADAPGAWVIGSDQVCMLGDEALGKPGSHDAAAAQLRRLSGHDAVFHTALCVVAPDSTTQVRDCPTAVRFRTLDENDIARYLQLDTPYDCAGSAKSEALGPALLSMMRSDDPTALIGLPLIALCDMLRRSGFDVLARAASA